MYIYIYIYIYNYINVYIYVYIVYSSLKVCWLLLEVSHLSRSSSNGGKESGLIQIYIYLAVPTPLTVSIW